MTDARFTLTTDGGEIEFENGVLRTSEGLEAAVLLSLFGGNQEDTGGPQDVAKQYWANFVEADEAKRYRSKTQHLLLKLAATTGNLPKIQGAAEDDLSWMTQVGPATSVDVRVVIPAPMKVKISVSVSVDGELFPFEFTSQFGK